MSPPSDQDAGPLLPRLPIPGSYGLPFIGAFRDRLDYFYRQGQSDFFKSRVSKHNSTVFRTNMPPGPFVSSDPRVVVLLDASSFSLLLDSSKVEKRNVLDGTYMPSLSLTGGHRMCAYLDSTEPKHRALKGLFLSHFASRHRSFIPLFRSCLAEMFTSLEDQLHQQLNTKTTKKRTVDFGPVCDSMSFEFVFRLLADGDAAAGESEKRLRKVREKGPTMFVKWLFFQLGPLMTLGLPKLLNPLEDLFLHTIPLPSFLARSNYQHLYDAFYASSTSFLDEAERAGIDRSEACHNLVFLAGFNAFGGMKAWFPALIKWVGSGGKDLHRRLAEEIRETVAAENGAVTLSGIQKMSLTKSVVYEAFRLEPPVPYQYGRCREDTVVRSHDAEFLVKKGEMVFGYQPYATRDPVVFGDTAEEFVADRFVGEEGERLLKYVLWSNGRETEDPTVEDKQCPAKELVVLLSRLMLVQIFLRYDTFEVQSGTTLLATSVAFVSLTKAT